LRVGTTAGVSAQAVLYRSLPLKHPLAKPTTPNGKPQAQTNVAKGRILVSIAKKHLITRSERASESEHG
jgi:hypothetical protein